MADTRIVLTDGDILDLTEALNLRIATSRDTLEKAELAGQLDGKPAAFRAAREAHIARLESLRSKLIEARSGRGQTLGR